MMRRSSPRIRPLAAVCGTLALVLVSAAAAVRAAEGGRYVWFDLPATEGASRLAPSRPAVFDIEVYRAALPSRWFANDRFAAFGEVLTQTDSVRVYGQWHHDGEPYGTPTTAYDLLSPSLDPQARRRNLLGVSWEHPLDPLQRVTIAAEYGWNALAAAPRPYEAGAYDTLDTRAMFSWTGRFAGGLRPSLTSGVYLGGETARDPAAVDLGRRYYGLVLGGELNLFESHTPYLAFRLQRSDYDFADPVTSARQDYQTLVSAGWKWQVQRGLSLQAEASYGYRGERLELLAPERSRLFFGTRFEFR
jgi:hypothetical protein